MTYLQKNSSKVLILILFGYPAYMWWSGDREAQMRCEDHGMMELVAIFDVKSLSNAPLGFISTKSYKRKINQCFPNSHLWDSPYWTEI